MDQDNVVAFPQAGVLEPAEPTQAGLRKDALDRLARIIEGHIAENRYPGAQIAVARHGKLVLYRSFGAARLEPRVVAGPDTLWLMYSNTKVVTACAVWLLVEDGALSFHDRVADHVPEFARHGKGDISVLQVLTHQGGFPSSASPRLPQEAWEDHAVLRRMVCDFTLEWTPGSQVQYHSAAAHWTAAVLIEAISKIDYRDFIRTRVIEPLGLGNELYVGLPDSQAARTAEMHQPSERGQTRMADENTDAFRRAGVPGGGGFATARAMAAFYQMLAQGGRLNGTRLVSPRMVQYVTRNYTGDRIDLQFGMPMHRGIGPHARGTTPGIRGLGSIASPRTFGHGGVGSSYCWADPDTGVSFAYFTNSRVPDPWHSRRLDIISNCVHAAIDDV
ncbi:MAG TPA: serine hydrolase domain-containing protein [Xanthobacteraceae bacterium]|nr:serine hydrolase domain-containing protein [Xanthobacteraceae bacterium]